MKVLLSSNGKHEIFVDDQDYDMLSKFKWYVSIRKNTSYAKTYTNKKHISMHRMILNPPQNLFVDHKDRNGLNNQRDNLRICTASQNQKNKIATGVSKYLGVSIHKNKHKIYLKKKKLYLIYINEYWIAHINVNGKSIHLGLFKDEIEAAKAYNKAAKKYHGDFARLNIIYNGHE